jgi:hypothetical protein
VTPDSRFPDLRHNGTGLLRGSLAKSE